MDESDNIADPGKGGDQRNEASDIQDQAHLRTIPVMREAVLDHITVTSNQVAPGRRGRMRDLAEELSRELPQGRAAWRG